MTAIANNVVISLSQKQQLTQRATCNYRLVIDFVTKTYNYENIKRIITM